MPYISEVKINLEDIQFEMWVEKYSDYLNYMYNEFDSTFDEVETKKNKRLLFYYLLFINSSKQKKEKE